MDERLLIKILGLLEKSYPGPCNIEKLMCLTGLKNIDGQISSVIRYLKETNKIIVVFVPESNIGVQTKRFLLTKWLQKLDEVTITSDGIDFLAELRKTFVQSTQNKTMASVTTVMGVAAFIQALIYFQQFSKEVHDIFGWLTLVIIAFLIVIIWNPVWSSLIAVLGIRK